MQQIGTSRQGRPIEAWTRVPDNATRRLVVIGGIHGNEPVSPPVVRGLVEAAYPDDVAVWLVPVSNPDGVGAGTRTNAEAVDLNRNFSWEWNPSDGGPAPESEPETQALIQLMFNVQPSLTIWVHQPLGYVSSVGTTDDVYEQAWSRGSGLRVRGDVTQHGGGESWTRTMGYDTLLVEVGSWDATPEMVGAQRNGLAELLTVLR